jgi:outer membrane protein TolC
MPEAEILPFPDNGRARLARALARLNEALADQATAVRAFRAAVFDLKEQVGRLDDGLQSYRASLEDAAITVMAARAAVRRLDRSADALAAACR